MYSQQWEESHNTYKNSQDGLNSVNHDALASMTSVAYITTLIYLFDTLNLSRCYFSQFIILLYFFLGELGILSF